MRHTLFKFLALFCMAYTSAQNVDISGTVQDESGIPIPGVNIIVKNTSRGSVSDFDGNFTVTGVEIGSMLTFSYIGYITKELVIANSNNVSVTLQEDIAKLDEVVVIGYGTQTKKEITGAVSVVSSESIEALNPTRIEQALQGQVAGVNITTQSGTPGGASTISIRGVSTNGDNRPLILVDGNIIEDLSVLNPNDIESMNILKDATAGIYGVRAANGVILITTKKGRREMPITVEYNAYGGFQQTTRKIPVLNATEYAAIVNEAYAAGGNTPPFTDLSSLGKGTDWQDLLFEDAPTQNHNILFRGGGKNSTYSYSGSFLTQDGIVGGSKSNFTRFTNNASYSLEFLKNFKFTTGLTLMRTNKRNLPENSNSSLLSNAINMAPTFTVYDENGDYTLAEGLGGEVINPLAQIDDTFNRGKVMKLSGNAGLSYKFLDHFTALSSIQWNYAEVAGKIFEPIAYFGSGKNSNVSRSSVRETLDYYKDYTFDATISYENQFNDVHNISAVLGTSVVKSTGEFMGATGYDIIDNRFENASIELASDVELDSRFTGRNGFFDTRLLSYFGRLQYNYDGKYLISAVVRRDGSTAFGPENRFAILPSGSIGWIASDENFLKDSNFINFLKIRASYGILGNDRIPGYRYISLLNGEGTYIFDDEELIGKASGGIANPEIKWEKQKTFDIGLDMRFLDNKLDITADYFKRRTDDLLVIPQVSGLLGTGGPPVVNGGEVENEGLEFAIGYSDNFSENFKFSIKYNVTYLRNEVLSVNTDTGFLTGGEFGISQPTPSRMEAGFPMGYFYGYQTAGIFQNQAEIDASPIGDIVPQPGDIKYVDQLTVDTNNDGIPDATDGVITLADRVNLGNPIPDATMGLNISLDYKNFDFGAFVFASIGNEIVRNYERGQQKTNRTISYLDRWTGEGTSNTFPRVTNGATPNGLFSDFYVEDGSFVRLQNVQLGYTFSDKLLEDLNISRLRLYVSASNLFTLTEYKGYDPTGSTGAPIGGGIDQGFYPSAKTFLLGINLKF